MKRKIIEIDENRCNGCGQCVSGCPEGALQMIDGKARLVAADFCDGLGACIGDCPVDAISITEKDVEQYNESKVMGNIVKQGVNVITAHLKHLQSHNQTEYLQEALAYIKKNNIDFDTDGFQLKNDNKSSHTGCPGTRTFSFTKENEDNQKCEKRISHLRQWPVQMHLISPSAAYFKKSDMVLAADCVAFSFGDFHQDYLKGKTLGIACPKLDSETEVYIEKIRSLIDEAEINTLTVIIMEVPCCNGLLHIAKEGVKKAKRIIPIKKITVGIKGNIIDEKWIEIN